MAKFSTTSNISFALKSPRICTLLLITCFFHLTHGKVCTQDNYDCSHQIGAPCHVYIPAECLDIKGAESVPSEPGGLKQTFFIEDGKAGMNVSWEFPDDGSVVELEGFSVEIINLGDNGQRECFKVDIPCPVNTNATHPAKVSTDPAKVSTAHYC